MASVGRSNVELEREVPQYRTGRLCAVHVHSTQTHYTVQCGCGGDGNEGGSGQRDRSAVCALAFTRGEELQMPNRQSRRRN